MPTQQIDRDTFLERLRASGLLDEQGLARAAELAAEDQRGKTVARSLVALGLLTRFQAEMIYHGRTDGFTLGQYRVLDRLGRGGMGRVFKAQHQTMHRVVALKVLAPELMKTERARKFFEREVRAAAKLVHPNIVTAYDANQIADRHYLVMEFVDGPNLHELVKERGPLSVGQACDFVRQSALGLQFAHEQGMVHRDIKPANLLVQNGPGPHCVVKVLDFGLARLHEPAGDAEPSDDSLPAVEQQVMGTPDYLSPEQARNLHNADIRSDLYALGCTFYYLLAGDVPFPGGTTLEKLVRHGSEDAKPVHVLRPDVPAPVSRIVAKLMAKRPEDRYPTPADLARALAPFAEQSTDSIPTLTVAEEPAARSGDSPWANIFDDDPNIPTVPADLSLTPVQPRPKSPRASRFQLRQQAGEPRGSVKLAVILAAGVLGFLIGACLFLILTK
jgi:serine/threonine-protein kinase